MPLLNTADAAYVGASAVSRIYLGSSLVWEPAAPGGDPPQFIAALDSGAFVSSDQPTAIGAPPGVAAGHYQLTAVYCVSSSPTFPAPPAGWSTILDEAFDFPDGGTSSGRLGLFESTTDTGEFSIQMTGDRVWSAVRSAWSGAQRAAGAPLFSFTPLGTAHATPAIDAPDNSVVVTIGASELANAGVDWGWDGYGAATMRAHRPARNSIESSTLAAATIAVPTAAADVSATFTLPASPGAQRAAMVSLVLVPA